jgi:hypothetical protein
VVYRDLCFAKILSVTGIATIKQGANIARTPLRCLHAYGGREKERLKITTF